MTPQQLYDAFAFPASCALGKRIFKKLFLENGDLTAADKRALTDVVGSITWQFTLKPTTLPIQPYRDSEREYDEIAVIEVELSDRRPASRIAGVVHRTIPYPVLLVLANGAGSYLSVATKRLSRSDRDRIIADHFESTRWLDGTDEFPVERAFLDSLRLNGLPHTHFLALYDAWVQRLVALSCADLSGHFSLAVERSYADRRAQLDVGLALDQQIRTLRSVVRTQTSFARQVELNTQIKKLEQDLLRLAEGL